MVVFDSVDFVHLQREQRFYTRATVSSQWEEGVVVVDVFFMLFVIRISAFSSECVKSSGSVEHPTFTFTLTLSINRLVNGSGAALVFIGG